MRARPSPIPATRPPAPSWCETGERALYLVTGKGQAIKYPVGVGRSGQQWFGATRIVSKHIKPAWKPPASIRGRRSPDFYIESGSPKNPMGAAALVLRDNELAIHGTNNPGSIGGFVSAGCIRMHNKDIMDLFGRVAVGTRVVFPRVAVASKPPAVSAKCGGQARGGSAGGIHRWRKSRRDAGEAHGGIGGGDLRQRSSRQPIGGAGGRHGALARNSVVEAARLTQRREALLDRYNVYRGALLFVSPWLRLMKLCVARRCVRRRRAARAGVASRHRRLPPMGGADQPRHRLLDSGLTLPAALPCTKAACWSAWAAAARNAYKNSMWY